MSTSTTDDIIRVACWNVEHNGRAGKRGARDRRAIAHDILASLQPHIVLRQELTGAHADGKRALYQEASRIGGLTAFMAPATPESPNPTGVMFDPRLFETVAYYEHTTAVWHPVCNPVVRLKGATKDLSLASIHLSSWDPLKRASEARRLTVLADQGRSSIFGGDLNTYPHRTADEAVPLPDWGQVTDAGHYERRTVERNGRRVADTIPDEIFTGRGLFTELGHYAAHTLDPPQPDALKPTASL